MARTSLVLLPPCDRFLPEFSTSGVSPSISLTRNPEATTSLMVYLSLQSHFQTLNHVLAPGMRKPFRDSKLTLYLRPFIRNTHITLIACLPPYNSSPSIIVKQYVDEGVIMRGMDQVYDTPNSSVYDGIMKYCYNLVPKQIRPRAAATEHKSVASRSQHSLATAHRSQTSSRQTVSVSSTLVMNDGCIDDLFSK